MLYAGDSLTTLGEARSLLADMVKADQPPVLSEPDLETALIDSRVRDSADRWITDPDYVQTYNLFLAAAKVSNLRAIREYGAPGVEEFTSEGSRFKLRKVDWAAVARNFMEQAADSAGLENSDGQIIILEITHTPPVVEDVIPLDSVYPLRGAITNAD